MSTTPTDAPREAGFEYKGRFYRWHLSDTGKDLMIIDRFTSMPVHEFFQTVEDSFDRGRGPILLAMIGTSIRHGNPDWSVERIIREVSGLSISEDIEWIEGEEEDEGPPEEEAADDESKLAPVASLGRSRTSRESSEATSETSSESLG